MVDEYQEKARSINEFSFSEPYGGRWTSNSEEEVKVVSSKLLIISFQAMLVLHQWVERW